MTSPVFRKAERNAVCRVCDKDILKGEYMVTFSSHRNCGMNVPLHPECARKIGEAAKSTEGK